jgi:uncharacterized protein YkwD
LLKKTVRRLALLAIVPATVLGLSIAAPADAAMGGTALVSQIVAQTNQHRAAAGCGPVVLNPQLTSAAVRHSAYMAATGNFSHTGRNGSTLTTRTLTAGYRTPLGENIGWGYRTGTAMMNAWMASSGHRANILNCAAHAVGVGVGYATNGTPYYTQDFGRS